MRTFALLLLPAWAFSHASAQSLPKPLAVVELPAELREVSGLTDVDANTVACLQDEAATLYLVNLIDGRIRERHPFGPPGDMEGLTRVGNDLFALRSDGLIYQVKRIGNHYATTDSFRVHLPHRNIEGLGYDPRSNLVLVAPKDNLKGGPDLRDQRSIFAFDPAKRTLLSKPVVTYSVKAMLRQAEADGMKLPMRTTDHGKQVPMIKFRMSSIAVNPVSGNYFILSAVDQTLLVLDRTGGYVALFQLDEDLLPKPEGITFLPDGGMLISSEGKDGPPRIVRYPAER